LALSALVLSASCAPASEATLPVDPRVGGQSGDDGDVSPDEPGPGSGDTEQPRCEHDELYAPPTPQRHSACWWEGEAIAGWRYGDPIGSGPYSCECPDGPRVSVAGAESCRDALVQACDADFDVPRPCSRDEALCWPEQGNPGSWGCSCSGDSSGLTFHQGEQCDSALFDACAEPACQSDLGGCERLPGAVGFACQCEDGSLADWPGTASCRAALSGCQPRCESDAGSCAQRHDGYDCTCASGDAAPGAVRVSNDQAYGLCPLALEFGCGPPPAGQSCVEDDEHATVTCVADGVGDWQCNCDRKEQPPEAPEPQPPDNADSVPNDVPSDTPATGTGSEISGVVIAPHPPPPAAVRERRLECYDAVWTACE
jgi:hypothetical protein